MLINRRRFVTTAGAALLAPGAANAQVVPNAYPPNQAKDATQLLERIEPDLKFEGHRDNIEFVMFSKDGSVLYSKSGSEFTAWNATTGARVGASSLPSDDRVSRTPPLIDEDKGRAIFPPKGYGDFFVIDLRSMRLSSVKLGDRSFAWSYLWLVEDKNTYVGMQGRNELLVINRAQYKGVGKMQIGADRSQLALAGPLILSRDGTKLVSTSIDDQIVGWDFARKAPLPRFFGHRGSIESMNLSNDGKLLLTTGFDGLAKWDMETGKELGRYTYDDYLTLRRTAPKIRAVSLDFKLAVAGHGPLFLLDVTNGKFVMLLTGLDAGLSQYAQHGAFSPNGKQIVVGTSQGELLRWSIS